MLIYCTQFIIIWLCMHIAQVVWYFRNVAITVHQLKWLNLNWNDCWFCFLLRLNFIYVNLLCALHFYNACMLHMWYDISEMLLPHQFYGGSPSDWISGGGLCVPVQPPEVPLPVPEQWPCALHLVLWEGGALWCLLQPATLGQLWVLPTPRQWYVCGSSP